ncbi:MAG: phosphoglycolate phosphatase [Gammaproteobacteria bacterium]|jgi:phosphoglycolate phosphatase|nr:phosphoglycolate phosphatase [Gammaproteobacteria bacterium]
MINMQSIQAWLFDLDGTLVDTVLELSIAFNKAFEEQGFKTHPVENFRPLISLGVRKIITRLSGISEQDPLFLTLREQGLLHYTAILGTQSALFDGVVEVFDALDAKHYPWGIVTGKSERFAHPLLQKLKIAERAHCIVCGDTVQNTKPNPEPLLYAAKQLKIAPENCVYVGDSSIDITAAKAANMQAIAVSYGYHQAHDNMKTWGADRIIDDIKSLLNYLLA